MATFFRLLQVRQPMLIHQQNIDGSITWLLDGVGKQKGAALEKLGWTWLRGHPGCWTTDDENKANAFITRGIKVINYHAGAKRGCQLCYGTGYITNGYMSGHLCSCINK